jgi:hypothetical protein
MAFSIVKAELFLVVLPDYYGKNLPRYVQCGLSELMNKYLVTPAIWSKFSDVSEKDVKSQMPEVFVFDTEKREMTRVTVRIVDLAQHGVERSEDGYYGFNAVLTLDGTDYSDSSTIGYFNAKA